MIIILKNTATDTQVYDFTERFKNIGFQVNLSRGVSTTILGLIGDTTTVSEDSIKSIDIVSDVKRITEPYKNANRKFHPDNTVVNVSGVKIGEGLIKVMAGPCSVESEEQIVGIAKRVKAAGATLLRGGAFKPRSSPYAFQGLHEDGLEMLRTARAETGLPIVSEIMSHEHLHAFEDIDLIQVGARNMQNFELLKELGRFGKPVLLKRGLANTIEEWLMSAEYIMAGGNFNVILCERGIRTFETATRNTLDISAVPVLRMLTHLPIIIDPSHASGISSLVEPLAMSGVAIGADGIMIEVHNNPSVALSDGKQSLTPDQFDSVMCKINKLDGFMHSLTATGSSND